MTIPATATISFLYGDRDQIADYCSSIGTINDGSSALGSTTRACWSCATPTMAGPVHHGAGRETVFIETIIVHGGDDIFSATMSSDRRNWHDEGHSDGHTEPRLQRHRRAA